MDVDIPLKFESERLTFSLIGSGLVSQQELHSSFADLVDPDEIFKYCSWQQHESLNQTQKYVKQCRAEWQSRSKLSYAISLKTNNTNDGVSNYIGVAYIKLSDDQETGELGLWLRKPYWNCGYSQERATRFLDLGFNTLDLTIVYVGCLDKNTQSLHAICSYMDRHGGLYYGNKPVPAKTYHETQAEWLLHHEFAIPRERYSQDTTTLKCCISGVALTDALPQNNK